LRGLRQSPCTLAIADANGQRGGDSGTVADGASHNHPKPNAGANSHA
jgi:hypothetical protein